MEAFITNGFGYYQIELSDKLLKTEIALDFLIENYRVREGVVTSFTETKTEFNSELSGIADRPIASDAELLAPSD